MLPSGQQILEAVKRRNDIGILSTLFDVHATVTEDEYVKTFVDCQGRYGETALMVATLQNNVPVVELLLQDGGADPNVQDRRGTTALMIAAMNNSTRIISLLLMAGANPGLQDTRGECAAIHAIKHGHREAYEKITRLLYIPLHNECQNTCEKCLSYSMLKACLRYNQKDMFRELFELGYCAGSIVNTCVNLNNRDIFQTMARSCVKRWNNLSLSAKDRSTWVHEQFHGLLKIASKTEELCKYLEILIDEGLSKFLVNPNDHLFSAVSNSAVLKQVMRYVTNINFQSNMHRGRTALMQYTLVEVHEESTCIEILQVLLDAGADVRVVDHSGLTVFHHAIYQQRLQILQCLMNTCAKIMKHTFFKSYCQGVGEAHVRVMHKKSDSMSIHGLHLDVRMNTFAEYSISSLCCCVHFLKYIAEVEKTLKSTNASCVLPFLNLIKDDFSTADPLLLRHMQHDPDDEFIDETSEEEEEEYDSDNVFIEEASDETSESEEDDDFILVGSDGSDFPVIVLPPWFSVYF